MEVTEKFNELEPAQRANFEQQSLASARAAQMGRGMARRGEVPSLKLPCLSPPLALPANENQNALVPSVAAENALVAQCPEREVADDLQPVDLTNKIVVGRESVLVAAAGLRQVESAELNLQGFAPSSLKSLIML